MFFYQPSGGSKVNQSYGEVKLKQFFLKILIADSDSLQKSMNVKWSSFFYILMLTSLKLDKTANFELDVLLFFLDFNDVNIKI